MVCNSVLYSAVLHSAMMHSAVLHNNVLYSAVLHSAVMNSVVLHSAVMYSAVLHTAVLYSAMLHITAFSSSWVFHILGHLIILPDGCPSIHHRDQEWLKFGHLSKKSDIFVVVVKILPLKSASPPSTSCQPTESLHMFYHPINPHHTALELIDFTIPMVRPGPTKGLFSPLL